jgi:glycosyltransferase involved in cell wall biosynthesis
MAGSALRIAMMGTRGVPARYGGFETCVEEVGQRLAARGHDVLVYCRRPERSVRRADTYLGMRLVHLPCMHRRSLETLSHTGLSVAHLARRRADVALVFNAANAPWLPVLRATGVPCATHVDGLEWQRGKWGPAGRRYYRMAERLAVRWSDALIADAVGIQDYYRTRFGAATELIAYGAPITDRSRAERLAELDLAPDGYHLVVARFEPENHVDMVVEGYCRSAAGKPLVVVGSAPYAAAHTQRIHALADHRVRFVGGLWDQELLDQLYANAYVYWHGHSVGGTNPSLLRAVGAGTATNAFDVTFNREVLGEAGWYFSTAADVTAAVEQAERDPLEVLRRGTLSRASAARYDWDDVAGKYEALCLRLADAAARSGRGPGPQDGGMPLPRPERTAA